MSAVAVPQHMTALARANESRIARCAARKAIRAGTLTVADALALPCIATLPVGELLAAQRRWGSVRATDACAEVPVSVTRAVRDLTDRQRQRLVEVIG